MVALLVQDGTLELDREVAHYWPEFAAEGKGAVTLRDLLAHRAGVVGADAGFTVEELADDRVVAERLAAQRPFWRPGSAFGYHALVIGALTGEVVRRATGRTLQELYEERVRAPYGLGFHLGLPESEEPRYRSVLPMAPTPPEQALLDATAQGSAHLGVDRVQRARAGGRCRWWTFPTPVPCAPWARPRRAGSPPRAGSPGCTRRRSARSTGGGRC